MSGSDASYNDNDNMDDPDEADADDLDDDKAAFDDDEDADDVDGNDDEDDDAYVDDAVDADVAAAQQQNQQQRQQQHEEEINESLKKMEKIVNNLIARADSVPFREPVDWKGLQLYDYPKIITRMMDLGTIKKNLKKNRYADASSVAGDIRLVWTNCMTYNDDGSDFYRLAQSYSKRFEERFQKLVDEFGEEVIFTTAAATAGTAVGNDNVRSTTSTASTTKVPRKQRRKSNAATSTGRPLTPVPNNSNQSTILSNYNSSVHGGGASASKASTASNHKINYEAMGIIPLDVRARFAARLQRLSGMELGHVLQTIDIQCPEALEDPTPEQLRSDATPVMKRHRYAWDDFDGGCQIEVDVDSIPPVTFWELDKYVKEKVDGRGRGPWSDDLMEVESGVGGKKRKMKSF